MPGNDPHVPPRVLALGAALAVGLLGGCGDDDGVSAGKPEVPASAGNNSGGAFVREAGYPIVEESPKQVADASEFAVRGTIVAFRPGRVYFASSAEDSEGVPATVMEVQVDEVVLGKSPHDAGESIYVELEVAPKFAERYGPARAETLIYLNPMLPTGLVDEDVPVAQNGAGRPAGEPVFQISRVQGLIVDSGSGVSMPAFGKTFPGAEFEEFQPDRRSFPKEADST